MPADLSAYTPFFPLLVAVIGLIGTVVTALLAGLTGGYLQHRLTAAREQQTRDITQRRDACLGAWQAWRDYVHAVDAEKWKLVYVDAAKSKRDQAASQIAAMNEELRAIGEAIVHAPDSVDRTKVSLFQPRIAEAQEESERANQELGAAMERWGEQTHARVAAIRGLSHWQGVLKVMCSSATALAFEQLAQASADDPKGADEAYVQAMRAEIGSIAP